MEFDKQQYIRQLKKRKLFCLGVVLGGASILTLRIADTVLRFLKVDDSTAGLLTGMVVGLAMCFVIVSGFMIGIIERALRNDDKLKAMWIKEHDERTKAIEQKTMSSGFRITAILLGFVSMIVAFFRLDIFIGIFIALIIMVLVKLALSIYYRKKM